MKRLIVNADDFGLTKDINRGIIESHQKGIVTSTTIMTNMPAFDDAICLIGQNSGLDLGVHLNLSVGKPLSKTSEVASIINSEGYFFRDISILLKKVFLKRACLVAIEKELRLQIEKALQTGIPVSHLDSHKHLHCYPRISDIVIKLAQEYGLKKMRYINEAITLHSKTKLYKREFFNLILLNYFCRKYRPKLIKAGILYPDYSFGIIYTGTINIDIYRTFLSSLPEGTTEIMCHPGYSSQELAKISFLSESRREELIILTDHRLEAIIKENGVQLISYRNLN